MALTRDQMKRLKREPGNRVRAARLLLDLTQEVLAEQIGVSQSALSDLERQRYSEISLSTAHKFAEFFGCAIEDLFPSKTAVAS